jgi:hypothetical protein
MICRRLVKVMLRLPVEERSPIFLAKYDLREMPELPAQERA